MALVTAVTLLTCYIVFLTRPDMTWSMAVTHPYTCVTGSWFLFCRSRAADNSAALEVDIWNAVAFVVFSLAFFSVCARIRSSFVQRYFDTLGFRKAAGSRTGELKAMRLCGLATAAWILLFAYSRTWEYGSLEKAAVAMYGGESCQKPLWLARAWLWTLPLACFASGVGVCTAIRLRRGFMTVLMTLLQISLILTLATRGARGAIITPGLATVLLALTAFRGRGLASRVVSLGVPVGLLAGAIVIAAIVGEIRSYAFEDIGELVNEVESTVMQKGSSGIQTLSQGGMSKDTLCDYQAFCFQHYGKNHPFLGIHTFVAIAVNPVPRELWTGKPLAFGTLLAREWGFSTDSGVSLAAGIVGEGYAHAGFLGILVFSAVFGTISGFAARCALWGLSSPNVIVNCLGLVMWRWSSMFVRGDMQSAFFIAFYPVTVFLCTLWAISCLSKRNTAASRVRYASGNLGVRHARITMHRVLLRTMHERCHSPRNCLGVGIHQYTKHSPETARYS